MGTNFYTTKGVHIGKRSAAGMYCWHCRTTLCEQGEEGVDTAEHLTYDGAVASDSMGLGSIVYFPRLPWVDLYEDEAPCSEPAESSASL